VQSGKTQEHNCKEKESDKLKENEIKDHTKEQTGKNQYNI